MKNKKKAIRFLENISQNEKVAIIHHDDLDGFASGVLIYDFCKLKKALPTPFCFSIGKSYLSDFNIKEFKKIILTDIPPSTIKDIEILKEKEVLYIDHHRIEKELPKNITDFRTSRDEYIPASRMVYEITKIKKWLAIIGTIGDEGNQYEENKKFIESFLKENKISFKDIREKSDILSDILIYFEKEKKKAFNIIEKIRSLEEVEKLKKYSDSIEKEISKYLEKFNEEKEKIGPILFYYFEPRFSIKGVLSTILSKKYPKDIIILAVPIPKNRISLSSRNNSRDFDLDDILKKVTENLDDAVAGGHKSAAGAKIKRNELRKFKENLKEYFADNNV